MSAIGNKIKYCSLKKELRDRWSFEEFLEYRMQELDKNEISRLANEKELWDREKELNDDRMRELFNDKRLFYERFSRRFPDAFEREFIFLARNSMTELMDFCRGRRRVILKPTKLYAGIGILLLAEEGDNIFEQTTSNRVHKMDSLCYDKKSRSDYSTGEYITEGYITEGYIAEDYIYQAREYSKVNPTSLNTVRVTTYIKESGVAEILFAINQFGRNGGIVDNDDEDAIWASIDLETGIVDKVEIDGKTGMVWDIHPDTGEKILGFVNPCWKEIKELALLLANEVPECRLIGWDIAVKSDYTLELIEGNVTPELDLYQKISGRGLRDRLEIDR